jgi:exopolysaccharide biosynthesis polyprenyl glycosylphosphotransferase
MRKDFLSGKKYLFTLALYSSDVVMFTAAFVISSALLKVSLFEDFFFRFFLFTLLILLINYSAYGVYKDKRSLFDDNDVMQILYSILTTWFIMLIFILMFDPKEGKPIALLSLSSAFALITTVAARYILFKIMVIFRKAGYDKRRTLFFGKNHEDLTQKIRENPSLGYDVVKVTDNFETLKSFLPRVDIVFLTKEQIDDKMLELIIANGRINWKIISSVLNLVIEPVAFDEFRDYPIINISATEAHKGYLVFKRVMDILLSGIGLILLSPLFFAVAIIIKKTMPGPVFFRQERLGKSLNPFIVYKFRSMVIGADEQKAKLLKKNEVNGLFKMKDDPRVTKFGKFLRRSGIDELPQLINIFKGDMAIVGPRPHLRSELENFKGWRMARFKVKPGLTGMWQVNGRHELNFDKAVLYDIYYAKHMSLPLDLSIILKTLPALVMNKGRF